MDFSITIGVIILLFIIFSLCGYCCKKTKQGVVYGVANPPTVTTHTEYTIPNANQSNLGFVTQAPYPTSAPYPTQHTAPYPPAPGGGDFSGNTPYPPMPMPGSGAYTAPVPPYPTHPGPPGPPGLAHQLPPSYAEAVTQPPQLPTNELYAKQSPYNPNYN